MKIKLELHTKNGALITTEPIEIESEVVPRVGEVIDLGDRSPTNTGNVTTFFVLEINHVHEDSGLVPHLTCRQWWKGDRLLELQQLGWLPPTQ